MDPTDGLVHVNAVFEAPVIVAVNAADWPLVIQIQVGLTEIPTKGISVTVADSTGCPTSLVAVVAVTVTVDIEVILAGAV
jgi:hypothetical protein